MVPNQRQNKENSNRSGDGGAAGQPSRFLLESTVSALSIELEDRQAKIESLKATLVAVTKKLNLVNDAKLDPSADGADEQRRHDFNAKVDELKQKVE